MKNLTKIFMAVVALFAVSCVTDTTNDLAPELGLESIKGETTLAISLEESRTHLGEKVDGLYQLHWSEGDMIAVNGTPSYPLTAEAAGGPNAVFSFDEPGVIRPYYIVYPAPAVMPIEEGEPAEGEGEPAEPVVPETPANLCPVTFLGVQTWEDGTFCEGAAPMYGYAKALGEDEAATAIQLQHLAGVLRIAPKGTVVLKRLTVTSESGAIAGPFMVDCLTGKLTAQEGATKTVTVDLGAGLSLDPAVATPIYVTVPNGNYGTFLITLHTDEDKMTVKFSSDVKPIAAGVVREFGEFNYEANTLDSENADFLIDSEEALVEFARIASTFYPRASAKVVADINMANLTEEQLKLFPIKNFGAYSFDGGSADGYTISNLTTPLFETTAAHIKNLKLTDVNIVETKRLHVGAIACNLYGSLENCEVHGKLVYNNTTFSQEDKDASKTTGSGLINIGGLVGHAGTAIFRNCTNYADVVVKALGTEYLSTTIRVGGAVGGAHTVSELYNVVNSGNVTVGNPDGSDDETCTIYAGVDAAGILGNIIEYSADHFVKTLTGCKNYGTVSTTKNFSNDYMTMLAGITPRMGSYVSDFSDNHNYGTIAHQGTTTSTLYMSGIVGYRNWSAISNCSNNGPVYCSGTCNSVNIGGILGQDASYTISNCTNNAEGKLYFTGTSVNSVQIGGIVGGGTNEDYKDGGTKRKVPVTSCSNYAEIYHNGTSAHGEENTSTNDVIMAGIIGGVIYNTVSDCHNTGYIHFDGVLGGNTSGSTSDNELHIGGIVGNTTNAVSTISRCTNTGHLYATGSYEKLEAGGISGNAASGLVEYCTNEGDIYTTGNNSKTHNLAGIIADGSIGKFKNCTNKGDVYVAATISNLYAGGICTYSLGDGGEISDCVNEGDIYIAEGASSNTTRLGGIHAVNLSGATAKITGCTNKGNIYNAGTINSDSSIGGIIGNGVSAAGTLSDCYNEGEVKNTGTAKGILLMGGIVAGSIVADATVSGCENRSTGAVYNSGTVNSTLNIGGVVGGTINTTISDCDNNGAVYNSGTAKGITCLGGIAGSNVAAGGVSECDNSGAVSNSGTVSGNNIYLGGIVAYGTKAEISACHNTGAISHTGTTTKQVCASGVVNNFSDNHNESGVINGCTNNGPITIGVNGVAKTATSFYVGGITNYSKARIYDCENKANGDIVIDGYTSGALYLGGIAGWCQLTNPTDAEAKWSTNNNKGDVCFKNFVGTTGNSAMNVGGIAGHTAASGIAANTRTQWENCTNEGKISCENISTPLDKDNKSGRLLIAGCFGTANGNWDFVNCHNKGIVDVKVKMNSNIFAGGLMGYWANSGLADITSKIANCSNTNSITVTSSTPTNAATAGGEGLLAGGIMAQTYMNNGYDASNPSSKNYVAEKNQTLELTDVSNTGAIKVTGNSFNDASSHMVGGLAAYYYTYGNLTRCHNEGTVTFEPAEGTKVKTVRVAGIAGAAFPKNNNGKEIHLVDCTNFGKISAKPYEVVSGGTLYVGGLVGTAPNTNKVIHKLTDGGNKGEIEVYGVNAAAGTLYVGGLYAHTAETTETFFGTNVNIGDIKVTETTVTSGKAWVGGIVGSTTIKVKDAKCYCDIQAPEAASRGWIMGTARTSAITATDCWLGATPAKTWDDENQTWVDGEYGLFDGTNFMDYIYGGTPDWTGVENYDGCQYLPEENKPTVEKKVAGN